ncbi:MAG: uracil-DNA glycosylase [Chloroflexi bacterium]|nr:uracil-DNA glycosylase [Chloroflexota bacterium]
MDSIASFVERLSHTPTAPHATNQVAAGDNPYTALRRANLTRYLEQHAERRTSIALIAEAPGYRGMRLTGVPMVSRRLLVEGVPSLDMLGVSRGYQDVPEPGFEAIQGEQTATILWTVLLELGVVPLVWAAFPFHPHLPGKPLTNRKPRAGEVKTGEPFLHALLDLYAPARIIAVGNVGHGLLTAMGIPCAKIRHPAQGGKNDFVAGLRAQILS